jgi:GNAT superfamily N-acetyltransferase
MCDEWMPQVRLALKADEFRRLPRNGAYQYDYRDAAVLTPRPRYYHALLPLPPAPTPDPPELYPGVILRPVRDEDMSALDKAFVAAFLRVQPFAALAEDELEEAAGACLLRTIQGGDGPWLREASFAALRGQDAVGAVFITLLPEGDPCEPDSYYWPGPPPEDFAQRHLGRPHLTWIFVRPTSAGHGVGTALLGAAAGKLVEFGYTQLLSTFLVGNDASLLWHWRSGFQLLSYPASTRRLARRLRQ